ncbi:MAG: YdcH family protein [Pikeienuella sp.]
MSLTSHLSQLREKHARLDQRIEEAARHPSTDDLEVTALKRQKLQLKEEIERLSASR